MLSKITQYIDKHNLLMPHSTVVVGLSGGPDSVCLVHILMQLQKHYDIKVVAAHLDHEWRPNSAEDTQFCAELATRLGIPFVTAKASTIQVDKKPTGSKEELGRILRRCFLESVAQEHGATTIALGHHYDDQQETFFIRLIRGASIAGLASMRPKAGMYVRPLLDVTKTWIMQYLKEHNLSYREDYTNVSELYLRNRIRLNVLPAVRTCDPRFEVTFKHTLESIQETDDFLDRFTETLFSTLAHGEDETLLIDKDKLLACDAFLYPRLLVHWLCKMQVPFTPTTSFFEEIIRFLKQPGSGTHSMHPMWSIVKKKNMVSITHL
jgi:tRNA(Ile)-lysidine synthase